MNCFAAKIAWRYLFARKGHAWANAINIVSVVSALAVAVVTAAMVCVMSVMNGFGVVVEQMFSEFDPELEVVSIEGSTFRTDTLPIATLYTLDEVQVVSSRLTQQALVEYKDHQTPAVVMGVDTLFRHVCHIDSIIVDGTYCVYDGAFERCVMGRGLAAELGMNAHFVGGVHIYAPKREARINMVRPDRSFNTATTYIAGCFAVNQVQYDDRVILVSIDMARHLFDRDSTIVSSLALRVRPECSPRRAQQLIARTLGPGFAVRNRYEQQADFYRIMRIEKLLTALLLVFILLIASFNIIGSLTMVMLDKKNDAKTLSSLGASDATIRRIFRLEGWLTSTLGAVVGLVAGLLLSLGQEHFGWLKLGGGTEYIIEAYPVHVQPGDIILIAIAVLTVGYLTAWFPTRKWKL